MTRKPSRTYLKFALVAFGAVDAAGIYLANQQLSEPVVDDGEDTFVAEAYAKPNRLALDDSTLLPAHREPSTDSAAIAAARSDAQLADAGTAAPYPRAAVALAIPLERTAASLEPEPTARAVKAVAARVPSVKLSDLRVAPRGPATIKIAARPALAKAPAVKRAVLRAAAVRSVASAPAGALPVLAPTPGQDEASRLAAAVAAGAVRAPLVLPEPAFGFAEPVTEPATERAPAVPTAAAAEPLAPPPAVGLATPEAPQTASAPDGAATIVLATGQI